MQRAIFQPATITQIQTQATRVLPGHGTGMEDQAINAEVCGDENSLPRVVLSVLANVVGGALLLFAMLILPHVWRCQGECHINSSPTTRTLGS